MTIKNFTDSAIHNPNIDVAVRIVRCRAAQEQLQYTTDALVKDQRVLDQIFKTLDMKKEQLFTTIPNVDPMQEYQALYRAYLILLARTLTRSTSPETSDFIRARFPFIPTGTEVNSENLERLRSKFINLLELHGEVRLPTAFEKLQALVQRIFARITGDKTLVSN